jgi:hypothetical protein
MTDLRFVIFSLNSKEFDSKSSRRWQTFPAEQNSAETMIIRLVVSWDAAQFRDAFLRPAQISKALQCGVSSQELS